MARRARIALSVFFGLLTVALCVLWARSYWFCDQLETPLSDRVGLSIESVRGLLSFWTWKYDPSAPVRILTTPTRDWIGQPSENVSVWYPMNRGVGFNAELFWIPHGGVTLIIAMLAGFPWIPHFPRFSLRTLLIATTLVAVVLGLAVWAGR